MSTIKRDMIILLALTLIMPLVALQNISPVKEGSKIKITGTSSLHDWEEEATSFDVKGDLQAEAITDLEVTIKTASIKSGKDIMDEKTHEALMAKKFPYIILTAQKLTVNGSNLTGTAQLQIAGKTNNISIKSELTDLGDNLVSVTGTLDITMSDYGIDPPTAMFGTMTTGDQVSVHYTFKLKKN